LAKLVGDSDSERKWGIAADKLKLKIDKEYWEPKTAYYYDTIRSDGSKDDSIRPNTLILLITGAVSDSSRAVSILDRVEQEDVTTSWGVRTLSSLDPKYHPSLYHDGAVWPLVTGWAAICEAMHSRSNKSLQYLTSMADRILSENGMFAETYRGDRPEPFNSCILQAWSVAMYVYALRELMLGARINMIEKRIDLTPRIPDSLKSSSVDINFEEYVYAGDAKTKIRIQVQPDNERITVHSNGRSNMLPEFRSTNYSVRVV
jgi:glycogen debranching enzyme